jgi:hypothetical protein
VTTAPDVPVEDALGGSGVAHSPQNFCVGDTLAPQAGHTRGRGVAHSPQNFWPMGFDAPQAVHITAGIVLLSYHPVRPTAASPYSTYEAPPKAI